MHKIYALSSVIDYCDEAFGDGVKPFIPGETPIPVSGALIDATDIWMLASAVLDGWFTDGKESEKFRVALRGYLRLRHVTLCNSGSSANLLAVTALSQKYARGKKILTCATGFPTTVAPIVQNGFIPVFLDVDPQTLNVDLDQVEEQLEDPEVVGCIFAHTLGFPFDAQRVRGMVYRGDRFFIEDICDALGATYEDKTCGSFGDVATLSFFPAHQICTGEGGAVLTNDGRLHAELESFNSWGRSCWCAPGQNDTCGKRFGWEWECLPSGWDHKYTFTKLGYNLKMTEMQASLGFSQMLKIEKFVRARNENYNHLVRNLSRYESFLDFVKVIPKAKPSPFGVPITVRQNKHFTKNDLVRFLEERKIHTRPVFGGNLTRQPMMRDVRFETPYPTVGSDYVMDNTFWIGCQPALTPCHLNYVLEAFEDFFGRY